MRHLIQVVDAVKGRVGSCTHCGNPATREARFDEGGAVLIEKYCGACGEPNTFQQLQEWYSIILEGPMNWLFCSV
jgi:hypothetical protein